jgi:hypothetical protein
LFLKSESSVQFNRADSNFALTNHLQRTTSCST